MKTRLLGLVLLACGILAAVLFFYLPLRDGTLGHVGPASIKGFVFVGFAVVIGLAFLAGGTPVLEAFQAKPKSREQFTLVLLLIATSGAVAGLAFWQLKRHARPAAAPVLLDTVPAGPPTVTPR